MSDYPIFYYHYFIKIILLLALSFKSEISKLEFMNQMWASTSFCNKDLLEHNYAHLFTYVYAILYA